MRYFNRLKKHVVDNIKFCPKSNRPVKALSKWVIPVFGVLSILWILIRLVPKPSRAHYPCMKVAIPFASTLILYLSGVIAATVAFRKAKLKWTESKYIYAATFMLLAILAFGFSLTQTNKQAYAVPTYTSVFKDPLGPNSPIGEAKGIFPGRVIWVHNPEATNKNCQPEVYGDGYFLSKNCDQNVVDAMLKKALFELTEKESESEAWNAIFKYHNASHSKGDISYVTGEKIYIKINAVHAWNINNDLSIVNDDDYGNVDTSPQIILALLRQLVNKAGVSQESIYIGDPYTQIFKHCYEMWAAEFPNIHYLARSTKANREKVQFTNNEQLTYSDKGTVLDETTESFFDCVIGADYILSVPAIKGHRWAGVTFFAKNHFGSNTRDGASHLHKGLHRVNYDAPLREGYNKYRVFVDIMGYKHLGGKTLLYLGDMLWSTSYEHDPPAKFRSAPFNDDWSSSLLLSLDPVAVSSVALDILQNEFKEEDLTTTPPRYNYVQFSGVDDYLHQAASSEWWPEGIAYDPNNDGTPMPSLGVHEHWNNATDKQYSRNMGTGDGIELKFIEDEYTSILANTQNANVKIYPTVVRDQFNIEVSNKKGEELKISIYSLSGSLLNNWIITSQNDQLVKQIDVGYLQKGTYVVQVGNGDFSKSALILKK